MKILLTHRYFWPDTTPYAAMLRSLAETFAKNGHAVHVFAGRPSYNSAAENIGGETSNIHMIDTRRCFVFRGEKESWLRRLANVILYCGFLFLNVLRVRPDVVSASSFPPVVGAATACLASRLVGAKFIYHVQDIHPEVSKFSGGRLGRGLPLRVLRWLDNRTLQRAAAVVTLSEDMAQTLRARGVAVQCLRIIDNFALESFDANPSKSPLTIPDAGYRAIFAGNLGQYQDLHLLSEGVARCFGDYPELELVFLGSGTQEAALKRRWGDHAQVRFVPFMPFADVRNIIAGADLGLVSLSAGLSAVARPSKLLTYEALGIPVLILSDPDSALAKEIEKGGVGVIARARTAQAIEASVRNAIGQPDLKERAAEHAAKVDRRQEAEVAWTSLLGSFS